MKIFIDIGHPAHVHYFRNFISIMKSKGHRFFITARDKEVAHSLLRANNLEFINRGKGKNRFIDKFLYIFQADYLLLKHAKKFKPDIFLSFASPYAAHVSKLMKKPHIAFDDTENAKFGQMFYKPFTDLVCSPTTFSKNFGKNHIKFNGYMELCYLHPNYFKPNKSILTTLGIKNEEKYTILRFVSWEANHDGGHSGITLENKIKAVNEFKNFSKVFISSEKELPSKLKKYKIQIPPEQMHDALAYASLLYGESATMASECAVLGVPSIFIDNEGRGYTDEEEKKYGLVYNFTESLKDQERSIKKGIELLKKNDLESEWKRRKERMLTDKIDVTAFMIWLIGNYPESLKKLKHNTDIQTKFKR